MSKLFKSLMRDSMYEEVTWGEEWQKADTAKNKLFAIVDAIPSVRAVARKMLEAELRRRGKTIDIDKVYINTDNTFADKALRPSGSLSDVMFYCLDNNIVPEYIMGGDGVFVLPETFDEQFKVSSLNVLIVQDLVSAVSDGLENALRSELATFWAAAANTHVAETASLTNKQVFTQAYSLLTSAELSLAVMAQNLDEQWGSRFAGLLNAETGRGAYQVSLQPQQDYIASLQPCFVLDNAERSDAQMKVVSESTGYVMHTPENGFEFFEKNTDLHEKLQARLSMRSDQIKYFKATQSVYAFCGNTHLTGQLDSVSTLLRNRDQLETPLTSALQDNQAMHIMRYGVETRLYLLWQALKRTEWPVWLRSASTSVQERYTQLEETRDSYEQDYQATFDRYFSLKDYVVRFFSEWADKTLGETLDPETITVRTSYTLQVASRSITQEDTRTLTEFLVFGLHDDGHRARIFISGAPAGSRLTSQALEYWLTSRNLRAYFVSDFPFSAPADYLEAYRDYFHSHLEFARFAALHSGHFNDEDARLISRAMAGDSSVLIRGLKINRYDSKLKNVLVFFSREHRGLLVYFKTPEGGFEFRKFSNGFEIKGWFESAFSADREYAALMINPDYLHDAAIVQGASLDEVSYRYDLAADLADLYLDTRTPLADYANVAYREEVALHKAIAPSSYRALGIARQQRYARLTTELKALSTVDTRDNGFPSFEKFTYDAIKQTIEEILRARGSSVAVNPDHIVVQTPEFRKSVTEVLLEGLAFEAGHPAYATKYDPHYFLINGHPDIPALDIRDLSSLSKTYKPGDRYSELLKTQFLNKNHPDYAFKRAVHAKKIRCEMHCNAMADYFAGRISLDHLLGVQRVLDSLLESGGYHPAPLDAPEGLYPFTAVAGNLTSNWNRNIGGVYIFRLKLLSGFHDLLYTPDAPDLVSFRPAAQFIPSIRFRLGPFREYYSNRNLIVDRKVVGDYFDELVATVDNRPAIAPRNGAALLDLYKFHDERVGRVLSDVDERTTSLKELIAGLIYENLLKAANIVALVVPPIGTVVVAVQLTKSLYDASQSHRRGDYTAALGHVKEALTGLVTLGKAAAAGAPVKELTQAQKSFLSFFEDARTAAELVTHYTGQDEPKQVLIDFFKTLMEQADSGLSKTSVR